MHEELPKYTCPFCQDGVVDYQQVCCGRPMPREEPYTGQYIEDCCGDPDCEPVPCKVCCGEGEITEDEYIYYL